MHGWEKKPLIWRVPLGCWRDFFLTYPKDLLLSRIHLTKNLGFKKNAFKDSAGMVQGLFTHCAPYQALLIRRLSDNPWKRCSFASKIATSPCNFGTICTKSEEVKAVYGKPNLFKKHPSSKRTFPLFQLCGCPHPGQPNNQHSSGRAHQWAGAEASTAFARSLLDITRLDLSHIGAQLKWSVTKRKERHFTCKQCITKN